MPMTGMCSRNTTLVRAALVLLVQAKGQSEHTEE